ncbi:MAG TPA: flagellar basal body P-ring protein FlgI [Myxococcota bacterium]
MRRLALLIAAALAVSAAPARAQQTTRVKDLVDVAGHRKNPLVGYGLVVGLQGQGDSQRVSYTSQSIAGMLGRLGVRVDPKDIAARNVAAVTVTTELPAFVRPGSRLDVTVSSLGDARSLEGGTLIMTPLQAVDGQVYALAQGPVQVGGWIVEGAGSRVQKNPPTTARVPEGAVVERGVVPPPAENLMLALRRPDATTAGRLADAINTALGATKDKPVAVAEDAASVRVTTIEGDVLRTLAKVEPVEVEVDGVAKVVISERTGTVVIGEHVRLRPVAIAHGGLRVRVQRTPVFAQPGPFSLGTTARANVAQLDAKEGKAELKALPQAATIDGLVAALNTLGVSPRDLIAILQALKAAGALDAELEVM